MHIKGFLIFMKITIVIPTRNGEKYVMHAIQSVLSHDYQDCEVLVSVNHSDDDTLLELKKINDKRLKILSPPSLLSMSAHFEWCIAQATGEWVTVLGDDDAIMPNFFSEFQRLTAKWPKAEAIRFVRALYYWPGCEAVYKESILSFMAIDYDYAVNSRIELARCLLGVSGYANLPQLYTTGIIKRILIERIRNKSGGRLIHELSPDIYSGVTVALETTNFIVSETPVFWVGTSVKSNGYIVLTLPKKSDLENEQLSREKEFFFLSSRDDITYSDCVDRELLVDVPVSEYLVYSSLKKVPFLEKTSWKNRWLDYLVYAGLKMSIDEIGADNPGLHHKAQSAYDRQIKRLGLASFFLTINRVCLMLLRKIFIFSLLPGKVGRKARRYMYCEKTMVTKDRGELLTISDANIAVSRLLR